MWKNFRYIFSQSDRIRLALLLLVMLLGSVVEMGTLGAVPLYVGIVQGTVRPGSLAAVGRWLEACDGWSRMQLAVWGGVVLMLLFLGRTLYMLFSIWAQARIMSNRWVATSGRFFVAYMRAPYAEFRRRNSGTIINNVVSETERLITGLLDAFLSLTRNAIIAVTVFVLLLWFDPWVSLGAVLALALLGGSLLGLVNRRLKLWGARAYESRKEAVRSITEGIGVNREAIVLGCQESFVRRHHLAMERQTECWRRLTVIQKSLWPMMEFVTVGVLLGTMAILLKAGRGIDGAVPTLALLTVSLARLKGTLTETMYFYTQLRNGTESVRLVTDELRRLEGCTLPETVGNAPDGDIEADGVCFRYPDADADVLHNVRFRIPRGTSAAFVGKTGAGKSTMAELLLGLFAPTAGEIRVGGQPISENMRGWRSRIGYVPQEIFLLDDTIRANVALGEEHVDEEALKRALAAADILDFVTGLPEGDRTIIGERGIRLSGGQRQRLGVARALYRNPPVLLFDEATSALDNATENTVVEAISRLRGDHTVIVIAHRLSTVRGCSEILHFADSGVESFGSLDELCRAHPDFVR